jgi:sucrose phosphorylase
MEHVYKGLKKKVILQQLALLRFRKNFPAFGFDAELEIMYSEPHELKLQWMNRGCAAKLEASLRDYSFKITATDERGKAVELKY